MRLSDAAIWPLVLDEALQLSRLSGTLFGIKSDPLDKVWKNLGAIGEKLQSNARIILAGQEEAYEVLRASAELLHEILAEVILVLDQQTPDFSERAVLAYLAGRDRRDCLLQVETCLRDRIAPLVEDLWLSRNENDAYERFWKVSSEAYLLTRCAVVAAASEGLVTKDCQAIRGEQKLLRGVERVASCWSPGVPAEGRLVQVERSILAEGFNSVEALLIRLRSSALCDETDVEHRQ
jgi:hypothetical protein